MLDNYIPYRLLGKGGMGRVYLAIHRELHFQRAIKILHPDLASRPGYVKRFRIEARLAARIFQDGGNVVQVFDIGERDGLHYLLMEYVEGETARQRLARKGGLGIREAATIVLGAARPLRTAHAKNLIHRDVKPENILISRSGKVKLADLGLAKPLDEERPETLTNPGQAMGTPKYMPYEQFRDSKNVGPPADVYALGATLYFLLTGRDGIDARGFVEVLEEKKSRDFPDPRVLRPDVPAPLARLVKECTRLDPTTRPQNAGEVVARLESMIGSQVPLLDDDEAGAVTTSNTISPPPLELLDQINVELDQHLAREEEESADATVIRSIGPTRVLEESEKDSSVLEGEVEEQPTRRTSWALWGMLAAAAVLTLLVWFADPFGWRKATEASGPSRGGSRITESDVAAVVHSYDVLSPQPGLAFRDPKAYVELAIEDLDSGTVHIGGRLADAEGGVYSSLVEILEEGENLIPVSVEVSSEMQSLSPLTIHWDPDAPSMPSVRPAMGERFDGGGDEGVEVEFDNEPWIHLSLADGTPLGELEGGQGTLLMPIPANPSDAEMQVEIEVLARDRTGLEEPLTLPITIRAGARIQLESPAAETAYLAGSELQLAGRVSEPRAPRVTLWSGSRELRVIDLDEAGTFQAAIDLGSPVPALLSLRSKGAPEQVIRPVVVAVPDLSVDPSSILKVAEGLPSLRVGVQNTEPVTITAAGIEPDRKEEGTYVWDELPLSPKDGMHPITVVASDLLERETKLVVDLLRDTTGPELLDTRQQPTPGSVTVHFEFDEPVRTLEVRRGAVQSSEHLSQEHSLVLLRPDEEAIGEEQLGWQAWDALGNPSSGKVTVVWLPLVEVPLEAPAGPAVVAEPEADHLEEGAESEGLAENPTADPATPKRTLSWATTLEDEPDPKVVQDPLARKAIRKGDLPWRVVDNETQIELLLVPAGQGWVGARSKDQDPLALDSERPRHQVRFDAFYLGRTEVTWEQWLLALNGHENGEKLWLPDRIHRVDRGDETYPQEPVSNRSFSEVQLFLEATGFSLPRECEWEYAAGAGGASLAAVDGAWTADNSERRAHPVQLRPPNDWGFYDMLGNVAEWTSSPFVSKAYGGFKAGVHARAYDELSSGSQVVRGGAWNSPAEDARCTSRFPALRGTRHLHVGFRVLRRP